MTTPLNSDEMTESYINLIKQGKVDKLLLNSMLTIRHKYYRIPDTQTFDRAEVAELFKDKVVLDFGCRGDIRPSEFHKHIEQHAKEVWGVDKYPDKHCKNFLQFDVEQDHWPGEIAGKHWDYIVAGDFIEHLLEPVRFLRKCSNLNHDMLMVITPNAFSGNMFGFSTFGIEMTNIDHYYLWSPCTLANLVEACGYKKRGIFYVHDENTGRSTESVFNSTAMAITAIPARIIDGHKQD